MKRLCDWVDPYIGTIGHMLTATHPYVLLPHSMAQIYPIYDKTIGDRYLAPQIFGFPLNGGSVMADSSLNPTFVSSFDHDLECVKCYKGQVLLEDSEITAEYTVTERCALYRFTFPNEGKAYLKFSPAFSGSVTYENGVIKSEGTATPRKSGKGAPAYYAATLNEAPINSTKDDLGIVLEFKKGSQIVVKAGFSYISTERALYNLNKEASELCFDEAVENAQRVWDKTLGRIEVKGGTDREKRIFYTSLYRVHQRMININEYGMYYSGFDNKVHEDDEDFYVNDGIWDTYRGAHPLQLLLEPERQTHIINSYLRQYKQCGLLPSFPHLDGSHAVMIGKHATAMITDSYKKGLTGIDYELAYEAMLKNETSVTKLPWALGEKNEYDFCYDEKGFFPALPTGEKEYLKGVHWWERRQCVAVTLETCYDEWCLSEMARLLNKPEEKSLSEKAQNYKNVFNPETGFMSPKTKDGNWVSDFNPKLSAGEGGREYFAECNSWTYTMHVQHDIEGLNNLLLPMGGLEKRLDDMFKEQYGVSKFVFLGQFPDSTGLIGQYCQGNEPSFHIPYMYGFTKSPWKGQRKLREIMNIWYDDTPLGICGDEDGGAMCAWYVFSAMGFYPVCPGKPEYSIGSPIFEEITIHLNNGKTFKIKAPGNKKTTKYITSATLNGVPFNTTVLKHADVVAGGELLLTMNQRPNKQWGLDK